MIARRYIGYACGLVLAVLLVLLPGAGSGVSAADPTTAPETSVPAESGAQTSDPAAPESGAQTSDPAAPSEGEDPGLQIKSGTAKQGEINWGEFGEGGSDAPKDLRSFSQLLIGWALSIFGALAVMAAMVVCLLMVVGIRGRSAVAKSALESGIWIWVAVLIIGSISELVGLLLNGALG